MGTETILFVGRLGYHNDNIIQPIIDRLRLLGHTVRQSDGNMDFFDPRVDNFFEETKQAIDTAPYDATIIVFSDYWNFLLPLYQLKRKGNLVRLFGFFHGSVNIEGDVCLEIPKAPEYEQYLLSCYDKVICPNHYAKNLLETDNCEVSMFPMEKQIRRLRPELNHRKKIIYAHRWNYDKGNDQFIEFVKYCRYLNKPYEFVVIGHELPSTYCSLEIDSIPWTSQSGIQQICKDGGYAWSSVRSETIGYAIIDLVSYGLTPLLNPHEAYLEWWGGYIYEDFDQAIAIVDSEVKYTNEQWEEWCEVNANNTSDITETILG